MGLRFLGLQQYSDGIWRPLLLDPEASGLQQTLATLLRCASGEGTEGRSVRLISPKGSGYFWGLFQTGRL